MNDRARYKGRMAIYAMAGIYLLAQAYNMFKSIPTSVGNEKTLLIVFTFLFAVIGVVMVAAGVLKSYKAVKADYDAMPEEEEESEEAIEGEVLEKLEDAETEESKEV